MGVVRPWFCELSNAAHTLSCTSKCSIAVFSTNQSVTNKICDISDFCRIYNSKMAIDVKVSFLYYGYAALDYSCLLFT